MVGVSRLELLTSRSQSARATNCAKPRLDGIIPRFLKMRQVLYNLTMSEFLSKRKRLICILAPTVFGIFYMFISMFNLQQSVWAGESFGAYLTHFNVGQIWTYAAEANQPPLYFWALKLWAHIFGHTDFAMRFMSVFFGALAIMFAYMWVKYKYGAKAAILSSLLLSISPVLVRYGQEMQSYTMATMFVFAGTYFLQLAIDNDQKRWWAIYAVIVGLGLWTNYFTIFAWLAHVVYLGLIYGKHLLQKKTVWTAIVGAILFIPWIPQLCAQLGLRGKNTTVISLADIVDGWSRILVYRETDQIQGIILVLFLITSLALVWLTLRYFKQLRLLLCMILVPTMSMILLSLTPFGLAFTPQRCLYSVASQAMIGGITTIILSNELSLKLSKRKKKDALAFYKNPKFVFTVLSVLLIVTSISGIFSAYDLGNYNFETGEKYGANLLHKNIIAADGKNNTPIIVANENLYFDLSFYDNKDRQSFILKEDVTNRMIKNSYFGRIDNLDKFLEKHQVVWYVDKVEANEDLAFPVSGYMPKQILTLGADETGATYEAILFAAP